MMEDRPAIQRFVPPAVLRSIGSIAVLLPLVITSACSIQTDKDGSGDTGRVKISTPLGGLNVRSKDVDAATLGLPEYPGAHQLKKNDDHGDDGSVDLHMGFGPWQMRVKVVSYGTPDAQDKVVAFYKKALGKYGSVIECDGDKPIGSPAITDEGLTCEEHGSTKTQIDGVDSSNALELKAGSKRREHIVGFKAPGAGETRFALISLELPSTDSAKQTD